MGNGELHNRRVSSSQKWRNALDESTGAWARARLDDARADELLRLGLPRFVQDWYAQTLFQALAGDAAARAALGARRADGDPVAMAAARTLSVSEAAFLPASTPGWW